MASGKKRSKAAEPSEDRTVGTRQRQNKSVLVVDEGKSLQTEAVDEQMQIYFRLMKTIPLEVKKSDTVNKVKTELSETQGISMANLKSLFFGGNSLDMKDRKLDDYGISNGSTINVFLDSGFRTKVHIKMSQNERSITFDVDTRDTILAIKTRIQNKEGIPASRQDLIYLGEQLDDGRTVASYNIVRDSVIYAVFHMEDAMQIYVELGQTGKTISLKVKKWHTVANLKNIIESTEGIKAYSQKLYNGNVRLENGTTLADLQIVQGQTLRLESDRDWQIFVKMLTGGTETFDVNEDCTVYELCEMIQEREGIHIEQQRLIYTGRRLEHSHTLADYGIGNNSTLHIVLRLCGC